jgi:hypothetical protein
LIIVEKTPKGGVPSREELIERVRSHYAPDYAEFLLVQMGYLPRICPCCRNTSFTTLWLADPRDPIDGRLWAKWYFWCDQCLYGIYCPMGCWTIPRASDHILDSDHNAISAALPENLKLLQPDRLRASNESD